MTMLLTKELRVLPHSLEGASWNQARLIVMHVLDSDSGLFVKVLPLVYPSVHVHEGVEPTQQPSQ